MLLSQKKFRDYVKPMLATLGEAPFDNDDWLFEIKWDGYRAIAETGGKSTRLYSRNGLNFQHAYPAIFDALEKIKTPMILDGEIVVYNDEGLPDFQRLQQYTDHPDWPIAYHVFDILKYKDEDQKDKPLFERKAMLEKVLPASDFVRYSDHIEGQGIAFFQTIKKRKMEGVMAKERNSFYAAGRRSKQWLKIKNQNTEEVVIAGFTEARGSRNFFGALILGRYKNGDLHYAGHTGTGFDEATLRRVHEQMQPLIIAECPFGKRPKTNAPATWVKPRLVANIKFTELTSDGIFRHPVFQGLRVDKSAKEVIENHDSMKKASQEEARKPAPEKKGKVKKIVEEEAAEAPKKTAEKNPDDNEIKFGAKKVQLTNQNKIYWPEEGYSKGDLVRYYQDISSFILPHLKDRPQSLHRFPNGITGLSFYQKDAGKDAPEWLEHTELFSESADKEIDYLICNNKASLAYLNNLGCIELNPWNSKLGTLEKPDYMVIDLDPGDRNSFDQVIEAALATKEILDKCKAAAYCKTSGSTGLHIYVPMRARYDYEQVKNFAHILASMVEEMLPNTTTLERNLKKRGDKKIYLDYLQNRSGQTLASVYSVRPKPGATVSMPLEWKEVKPGLTPQDFTMLNALQRVKKKGDIFKPVLGAGVDMHKCLRLLGE